MRPRRSTPLRRAGRAVARSTRGAATAAVPRPFAQGDLDWLCGVYAVINAVRLAARPHCRLGKADCGELFAALLAELAGAGRLRGFVTGGMGRGMLVRLLRRADRWLRKRHGLALEVSRPFAERDEPGPEACLRVLAAHLARPGTAAIVGSDEHWTVVRAVTPRRLLSFPRRSGRVVKVDLFRPGDPCPGRDVGSRASSRARR